MNSSLDFWSSGPAIILVIIAIGLISLVIEFIKALH
jgi:hypothetical protein